MQADKEPRRKLAAILSADVAGYSRLMGEDETATLATLNVYRDVFSRLIVQHQGRVVDTAGDSVLAMFDSVVEAVQCAAKIQEALSARNAPLPEVRRMKFRVGVNLGDVIEQADGSIYGDGVNIAARLQALADPGEIYLSGTAYDQIKNKLSLAIESLGEKSVKNIAEPVRVYRVSPAGIAAGGVHKKTRRWAPAGWRGVFALTGLILVAGVVFTIWQAKHSPSTPDQPAPATALKLPEGPSIAVLPFQNMSGKPDEDWFSDGMTETLITDLSRLNNLFVIARNSTFTYKGKPVDVRRVGQELGVRYVLEGSIQRTNERLRVNAQLVDAQTGRHLWAERYDRKLADIFDIQDHITQRIVTELDVKLLWGEQARAWRKATRNVQAYDLYLKGREHFNRFTREDMARAQVLFHQSVDLDPKFTMGILYLGWTHVIQGDVGWSPDPKESYFKAVALGREAAHIDPLLGDAYNMLSGVLVSLGQPSQAVAAADKALSLSPNHADILAWSGTVLAYNGRAEEGVSLVQRAFRRNPFPHDWYFASLGDSLLFSNRIEEAIVAHRKCLERIPDYFFCHLGLAVAYAESGKLEQATAHAKEAVRSNPKITADDNAYVLGIGVPKDRTRVVAALRRAGLK